MTFIAQTLTYAMLASMATAFVAGIFNTLGGM